MMRDEMPFSLFDFIAESNRIEGIWGVKDAVIEAHEHFLAGPVTVEALESFIGVVQPGAKLRRLPSMNVRVGMFHPPKGGEHRG